MLRDAVESESQQSYCTLNTLKKIICLWNPDYDLSEVKLEKKDPIDDLLNDDDLIRELYDDE